MPTFTPPTVADRPPYNADSSEVEKALFKFMPLNSRYVSVFELSDGTFVQDTATAVNANTNVPYPWDPDDPSAPYATAIYVDYTQTPPQLTSQETGHAVWIRRVYNGVTTVSDATATLLTAAGYGAYLS